MKLQVAIDRVPLEQAVDLAKQLDGKIDILEVGTSLVKDYGNTAIQKIRNVVPQTSLLVDSKTIDEGAYEFTQVFRHGGDMVTVMGAASIDTLQVCYEEAQKANKTMMIDLLEVSPEKMDKIKFFPHAIYSLHHSVDRMDSFDATATVEAFHHNYPEIKRLAIAGGIDLLQAKRLSKQGLIEIVIVGSKITKATDPVKAVNEFMGVINK